MRKPQASRRTVLRGAVMLGVGTAVGGGALFTTGIAHAEVPTPEIMDCDGWGAKEPSGELNQLTDNPNKILVHHTQSANVDDTSQQAAIDIAREIQHWHMDENGWSDSGQHFTISRGGYVLEGRHTSLKHLTDGSGMVQGAHAPGQNTSAIGIENQGTYFEVEPPAELWTSLVNFCAYTCQQYGIAATEIYGHRDYVDTDCPGDVLYNKIPQLREEVQKVLDGS
ncbi:peptidoglycan recognition protein family protein [Stackebrandtia nassauensis]|uniref:N-acetylmuramoyl-L-alanine amidase family 2 n=1 Tax=Stackebrandtia nassauensis (strain DSM 44728 / CIP 108903 / NRRL B-16338 / NBRC 102104 / LLR-40K-21) TaxID=446470 RepID=D3PZF2_STANL|nr:peptidoglycan recognition family protein [Stackebrandtia nassauensis]ADD41626.1 N-acetylmuramoyl-L-alanine amidase family 2 [Stackebrandtia nassauensis DSM 44728]